MSGINALGRGVAGLLIPCLALLTPGCAALAGGKSQSVRLQTARPGEVVFHDGRPVVDGGLLIIDKRNAAPYVEDANGVREYLSYKADPWLVGDGLLLFAFVIPGVVALVVDFSMGTWRDFEDPQVIRLVSAPAPATP